LWWRSSLFILGLFAGWIMAVPCLIVEFAVGQASEGLVTSLGVTGVSFSWWAPLIYAMTSEDYKLNIVNMFQRCCFCYRAYRKWCDDSARIQVQQPSVITRSSKPSVEKDLRPTKTLEVIALPPQLSTNPETYAYFYAPSPQHVLLDSTSLFSSGSDIVESK